MNHFKKISTLEEKASYQVAINLCKENGFKEVAMCLEKPTYGTYIHDSLFEPCETDPDVLKKMKKDNVTDKERLERWEALVDEQCKKLMKVLPFIVRNGVHIWITRIALEYLSYSRRLEVMFGISRYFLMDIITQDDWMEGCRLDEKKLAKRMLRDKRLTILHHYRIACVYCLQEDIPQLYRILTEEDKECISNIKESNLSHESHRLLLIWTYYMDFRGWSVVRQENQLWTLVIQEIVCFGNQVVLTPYWKELDDHEKQRTIVKMALQCVQNWQSTQDEMYGHNNWREELLSNEVPCMHLESINRFNLPPYYSRMMCFFLTEMNPEQELAFFVQAFERKYCQSVLECFLDWPLQDYFLPTVNRLWGIIPKDVYGQCLLNLARKYSGDYEENYSSASFIKLENQYYDYRSLLRRLWDATPEEYKKYVFQDKTLNINYTEVLVNEGKILFPRLLKKSPFQEKDEALFQRVFNDLPQEERIAMIHSEVGEKMCLMLTQKERWYLVNWLVERCLPKKEIFSFKKQFIHSDCGRQIFFCELEKNPAKLLEDLIEGFYFELDAEKIQSKSKLVDEKDFLYACEHLLSKGNFAEGERMMKFFLSSDEMQEQFKAHFARCTCSVLLKNCSWEQMDKILAWSFGTEEKIRDFKKDLFSCEGIHTHYKLVFIERQWENVEYFYKWFCLSEEEIEKIKRQTLLTPEAIQDVYEKLCKERNVLVAASLRWCLTDEKTVISLKARLEEQCFEHVSPSERKKANDFLKEILSETSGKRGFEKDKGEKRPVAITGESSSPRKRFK